MEWQELMKSFPVTTSTAGNERTKTTKEIIVIAQYMRTWNFSESLKKYKIKTELCLVFPDTCINTV
jgi:hypothetical protein